MKTITKKDIDSLYRKVGIELSNDPPGTRLNTGTMSNRLSSQFKGARKVTTMKGSTVK